MLRTLLRTSGILIVLALAASPASAQIVQSLQFGGGVMIPRGYDARASGDVLVRDLDSLYFRGCLGETADRCNISKFTSGQVFGEWLLDFGNHIEFGAGVGFYGGGTPSAYRDYTAPDNSEIQQDLRLRVVPVTGLVRFLAGRPGQFQPYFGVGVSALNFRYTESGEFIDFTQLDANNAFVTFTNKYTAKGTAVGPVVVAGFRAPLGGDIWNLTMEWRYQAGTGNTGGSANGFLDDKIDLGSNNVNFGVLVRF